MENKLLNGQFLGFDNYITVENFNIPSLVSAKKLNKKTNRKEMQRKSKYNNVRTRSKDSLKGLES